MDDRIEAALTGDKRAIARLVSVFEDSRPDAGVRRAESLRAIDASGKRRHAQFIGVTGTPGAGKSSLLGELGLRILARDTDLRVGVLAVDPASARSGGALLGDRTRVRFPAGEPRLYFRSQSSEQALGGLGRHSFQVARLMHCLFDVVFLETVGIGQSETEVRALADRVYLVMQPFAGDQVQFMKAGIMEIPDVFLLNKCDEEKAARQSLAALRSSLRFARPDEETRVPVYATSVVTGRGLDEVVEDILGALDTSAAPRNRLPAEDFFFRNWVRTQYGELGLRCLAAPDLGGPVETDYDARQIAFDARLRRWLMAGGH
jgi:LAO/AO transport system kinase